MSRYITKVIYLDLSKRPTIWNGGSTKVPKLYVSHFRYNQTKLPNSINMAPDMQGA